MNMNIVPVFDSKDASTLHHNGWEVSRGWVDVTYGDLMLGDDREVSITVDSANGRVTCRSTISNWQISAVNDWEVVIDCDTDLWTVLLSGEFTVSPVGVRLV